MRFSRESLSKESDSQHEKHAKQKTFAYRGIVMSWLLKEFQSMRAAGDAAARDGKGVDGGTITSSPDANPTPATT
jgi:hypothetical protein